MKQCSRDGHQWDDDYDFCPYCGTMLKKLKEMIKSENLKRKSYGNCKQCKSELG